MGYYIQVPNNRNKAAQLVALYKAEVLNKAPKWEDVPSNKAIICVVDNSMFEAAGFAYDPRELEEFSDPKDKRRKQWLLMDKELVIRLLVVSHVGGIIPK